MGRTRRMAYPSHLWNPTFLSMDKIRVPPLKPPQHSGLPASFRLPRRDLTASADLFSSYEISRISSLILLRVDPEKTVERAFLMRARSAVHGMEGEDRDRREMHRGGFVFCRTRLARADMLPTRHDAAEGDSR